MSILVDSYNKLRVIPILNVSFATFSEQFYVTSNGQIGQYPGQYSPNQTGQYPPEQAGQYPFGQAGQYQSEQAGHLPPGSYPQGPKPDYSQQPPAYSAGGFVLDKTDKSPV